jgi:hypothetical protein
VVHNIQKEALGEGARPAGDDDGRREAIGCWGTGRGRRSQSCHHVWGVGEKVEEEMRSAVLEMQFPRQRHQ